MNLMSNQIIKYAILSVFFVQGLSLFAVEYNTVDVTVKNESGVRVMFKRFDGEGREIGGERAIEAGAELPTLFGKDQQGRFGSLMLSYKPIPGNDRMATQYPYSPSGKTARVILLIRVNHDNGQVEVAKQVG